jgi:hypothetical protein
MSNTALVGSAVGACDDCFAALADSNCRAVVRLVSDRSPAEMKKADLASELAGVITDKRPHTVTDEDQRRALVELHHRLLPRLTDAGLLEETDGALRSADHWLFETEGVEDVIADDGTIESDELDAVFTALADERRRTALRVLSECYTPITTEAVARDVAAREAETAEYEVPRDRVDDVLTSLVHVHLPLLHDATLVGYDDETERVSYEGHPAVPAEWMRAIDGVTMADRAPNTTSPSQFRS